VKWWRRVVWCGCRREREKRRERRGKLDLRELTTRWKGTAG
jgi:hypothetical protein